MGLDPNHQGLTQAGTGWSEVGSVSKSSQVPTFCDFFDLKNLCYKFRENPEIHRNIREDRTCKRPRGSLWDGKFLASHCQDNHKI
jgi:hypothetical protein